MINPESLDLSLLPTMPLSDRKQFPNVACIYFAMSSGVVQYIGRSVNLQRRWLNHHQVCRLPKEANIAWLEISALSLLPEIELALIKWFKPPLNKEYAHRHASRHEHGGVRLKSNLPALMESKGVDQKTVIAQTGLNQATISKFYRNYIDQFDRKTVEALCEYFQCTKLDDLIQLSD